MKLTPKQKINEVKEFCKRELKGCEYRSKYEVETKEEEIYLNGSFEAYDNVLVLINVLEKKDNEINP